MNSQLMKAASIVRKYEYEIALLQDLEYIAHLIPKSALKHIDPKAEERIQQLMKNVQAYTQQRKSPLTAEGYLFVMLVAGSHIRDDHTNIFIHELRDDKVRYAGFLATYEKGQVIVIHSSDARIPQGAVIQRVNGIDVERALDEFSQWASPSTENPEVNCRRAAAYLGVYNPFHVLKSVELESGKTVAVKYKRAYRALFGRKSIQSCIMKSIYKIEKQPELGVSALQPAGMLYFDLHTFQSVTDEMARMAELVGYVQEEWVEWIVLDLRNNFGGTLLVLNQFIRHLYGEQLSNELRKCTSNCYQTNDEFLNQYYKDFIMPVLHDPQATPHIKKLYKEIYSILHEEKAAGEFQDASVNKKQCAKDLLSDVKRKVARDILKGKCTKKVILLTDSHCYSACVWTSKFLATMPNCVLIGKGVSDTKMSANALSFELPSNKGSIAIPQVISQLHNPSMQKVISAPVKPDYMLTEEEMKNRQWLVITLVKNARLLNQKIQSKCEELLRR